MVLCAGETALAVHCVTTLPPGQYESAGHWVQVPPLDPLKPGLHAQSLMLDDPCGALELGGQELRAPLRQIWPAAHSWHEVLPTRR